MTDSNLHPVFQEILDSQLSIPDVSNRRKLYFAFMKEYNLLMGESEHQILKEEVEVLLANKHSGDMKKIDQILDSLYDRVIEPIEAKKQLLDLFTVIKSVCVHPYEKVYQSETECYCEICGHDFTEQTVL